MTLNELKKQVAALGFESFIEDEDVFISSANRALNMIYTDRPVSKNAIISVGGPRLSVSYDFIEHKAGDVITLNVCGQSMSFYSTGVGECLVSDSSGTSIVPLLSKRQMTKKIFNGEARITFRGSYYFTISNFAVFEDLISEKVVDVPEYTPRREIEPTDYCKDFRALAEQPTDSKGNIINTAVIKDGRISLPFAYRGDVYLTYYRTPVTVTGSSENEFIDVSPECEPLLPLLTASFMWLDDDAAKAQYYMSLYRDAIANIRRYSSVSMDTKYHVNGWA